MNNQIESELLASLPWLEHGFGTRHTIWNSGAAALVKQIHSNQVVAVTEPGNHGEADAITTSTPGLVVGVKTADCLPILLADLEHRAVAAVHAGWRGTAARIVAATLSNMSERFGTRPGSVFAAIGPGIGRCCFEVGPEVAREFGFWRLELAKASGKRHVDLIAVNRDELLAAGVPEQQIDASSLCTVDRTDLFYSFRKERESAGRMLSWIKRIG
jgi:hypothetical protein